MKNTSSLLRLKIYNISNGILKPEFGPCLPLTLYCKDCTFIETPMGLQFSKCFSLGITLDSFLYILDTCGKILFKPFLAHSHSHAP